MLILDIKAGQKQLWHYEQLNAYSKLDCSEGLSFDIEKHEYLIDGKKLPSVTDVLSLVTESKFYDKNSAQKGTYIHKCTELWDRFELDSTSLEDEIKPYIQAWEKFKVEFELEFEEVEIEKSLYSKDHLFAGTVDRRYPERSDGLICVYLKADGKFDYDFYDLTKTKEKLKSRKSFENFLKILYTKKRQLKLVE